MKPADSPEFFLRPPPAGRSRESSIVLDEDGRFWHDGRPVEHPAMARAFASWIDRHPHDHRYILNNGYDWTYLTVRGAPLFVKAVTRAERSLVLGLSNGTEEPLRGDRLYVGPREAVFATVKDGSWLARFTREAQLELAPFVVEGPRGEPVLRLGGRIVRFESLPDAAIARPIAGPGTSGSIGNE